MEEINNQKANDKIEELEKAKQHLEQEVYVNKRRLEMETLATKQVTSCLRRHCCSFTFVERPTRSGWEWFPLTASLCPGSAHTPSPNTLEGIQPFFFSSILVFFFSCVYNCLSLVMLNNIYKEMVEGPKM